MQCGEYNARVLTFLVLMVLVVVGGGAAIGGVAASSAKRKRLKQGDAPKALPASTGGGNAHVERTVRDLKVNDVVVLDGKDYLVEGTIGYDEDGHRWGGARVVDGKDVRWLVVGIERTGAAPVRMLTQDTDNPVSGYPPEVIVIGELRYKLDKRGTATCKMNGDVGALSDKKDGAVDRCRWWLYSAAGDDTLVLEEWSGEKRMLRGKKVSIETIDLIPGS